MRKSNIGEKLRKKYGKKFDYRQRPYTDWEKWEKRWDMIDWGDDENEE